MEGIKFIISFAVIIDCKNTDFQILFKVSNRYGATATTYTSGALISTTQFRLQASNSNGTCTSVYSNIVTVTVNFELQPGAISGNQTICYNAIPEELTSTTAASGGIGTYSYQWQVSTDNGTTWTNIGGATATTYTPGALIATTQYRRGASNSDATCATVYSSAVTVTVNPELEPGTIANNQTICYNSTPEALTSATTATGGTGTYAYQWQISTDGGTTWTNINSATATTYAPGTLTATTQYRREASNSDGTCDPVYSNAVTITVNPELEPASISDDQTICYNGIPDAFALATSASGGTGTYTYQWQSSTDNGITWTNISSETATTYTSGALISTTQFRLQASNSNGTCASVYSNAVTITVNSELQPGTISGNQTICYNAIPDELTSTTAASGGAGTYAYQWQVSTDNGTTWTNIGSATAITYVPGTLTTTTQYRREAKNSDGTCDAVYSNVVTVTVNSELEPGIIANNQTICYNSIPEALTSTTATGGTGTYVYQWQITTDGGTTWTNINSATATTYAPGTLTTTTQYRREASNSNGTCDPVYSNAVTITVNPELEPGSISDNQTICYNAIPDELTSAATASGGIGTYVYQWQNSTDNGVTWTNIDGATASAYTPVALTTTTQYRREARNSDGACDAVYSNAITITVKPELQPGVIADNQTICYNAMADELTSTAAASGGFGAYAYQWQYSTDNGTTWADIAGATAITYAPGILTSTMQFRRATTGGDCGTVYSDDITITVNSLPTDKLTNPASFCEGTLTTEPSKTMGGYNIIWYDDALGSSVSTEPSVVTQTATNSPYTFYYKVQDALTLCYGSMNTYEVTVDAIPLAPNTTPVDMLKDSSPNPETISSGATSDIGHTLYWYASETSTSGSTSAPSQDKSTAGTYYYWVSQKNASGCESERVKVTVNVYDAPLPSVSNATYCQDETPALLSSLATADAGHTLYWYSNPADVKGSGSSTMPIISTSTPGTYTFYVSQRNNTTQAESEKAAITITVHPLPVVPSITLDDFCQGGTAPSLAGTISGLTIEWQDASGSTITSISSSTGNTPGVHNYTAIATDANGCVSAPSTIPVEVIANPSIPTVNNDVVYYREDLQTPSNTFKDLMMQDGGAVTASSGSTLYWSADGLSWSTTPPVPPTPSEDDYTDKSYTYKVKQMLDGPTQCESPSTTVEAKIYLIPVPKVKKISYCEGETPSQLSSPTVEVDPTGGYALEDFELRWHGTGATPSTGYTTEAPTPSASTPGTTTYWVSQYNKGTQASSSPVKLEVIVYAKPTLSITAPLAVCSPLTVNISGNSGVWNVTNNTESFPVSDFYYEDINKTTILSTPGAIPTIGKRDYYIQVAYTMPSTAGGDSYCYSEVNPVEVNIEDLDKPVITGVTSTCPNTAVTLTAAATSTNPGTVSYSWIGSNGLSGTSSSISTGDLAGSAGDSYTFSVTASAGTCSQTSDIHTITIGDGPVEGSMTISEPGSSTNPSVTFNNDQISDYYTCGGSVTIHTSYTGSDFQWKEEGSPTSFPGGGDLNVTPVGTKTYILSYVNGCPTEVKVKIHSIPLKVDSLYNSLEMCEGEPFSAKLNISCSEIPTIQWYKDGAPYSGSSSDKLDLPTSKPSDSGVYSYKVTNRGCEVSGQIGSSALKVKPYIQFTNQAEYVVERGEPVTMPLNISVPSSPSQPSTIEWKENGVIVNTQTSYTIPSVTQDHHFKIKLSDPNYCADSSTLDVLVDAHLEMNINLVDTMCYDETRTLVIDTTGTGRFVEAGHMLQVFETIEMIRKEVSGWTLVGGKLHLEVSPKKDASYEVVFTYKEQKVTKTTAITVLQPIEIVVPDIQTICEGESVTLSLKSVSPAGTTVEWFDQGVSMNEFSETIIATPAFTPGSGHQSVYTYIVKANYSNCDEKYYDVEVKVDESLRGTLQAQSPICEGNSSRLDASGYEAASYIWRSVSYSGEKSGVEQIERPTLTTEYYVEMSRGTCSHTDSIEVEVNSKPRISYIDSIDIRAREIVMLPDYGTHPFTYGVDNEPVDNNAIKENLVFGKHSFYVIDALGCHSDALDYFLEAIKIIPPHSFSPNGDNKYDTWDIINIEVYPNAVVTIYDRFGKKLAEYKGSAESGWDGTYLGREMPTTDYWYVIDIDDIDK